MPGLSWQRAHGMPTMCYETVYLNTRYASILVGHQNLTVQPAAPSLAWKQQRVITHLQLGQPSLWYDLVHLLSEAAALGGF